MVCIKCSKDIALSVLEDSIFCPHCQTNISINHFVCDECGILWKSVGNSVAQVLDISDIYGLEDLGQEESLIINTLKDIIDTSVNTAGLKEEKYLCDFFHKCIKCSGISVQVSENVYRCVTCNFEWSVS